MGNSQTGGGGSVQWRVDVKQLKRHSTGHEDSHDFQDGADTSGREGIDNFTVRIAFAGGLDAFKALLHEDATSAPTTIWFEMPITGYDKQIVISWPDSEQPLMGFTPVLGGASKRRSGRSEIETPAKSQASKRPLKKASRKRRK